MQERSILGKNLVYFHYQLKVLTLMLNKSQSQRLIKTFAIEIIKVYL